jgi:hypothetical protein
MRCSCRNGLFDIDQTEAFTVFTLFTDPQQHGEPVENALTSRPQKEHRMGSGLMAGGFSTQ